MNSSDIVTLIRSDWDIAQLERYDAQALMYNISQEQSMRLAPTPTMPPKPVTYKDEIVHMVLPPTQNFSLQ